MLSARAGEEARVEGLDAGADDYLTKPFSARELVARVNANLEMARSGAKRTRDLRRKRSALPQHGRARPGHDVDDRRRRVAHLSQSRAGPSSPARPTRKVSDEAALDLPASRRSRADRASVFFGAIAAREPFRIEYRLRRARRQLSLGLERGGAAVQR